MLSVRILIFGDIVHQNSSSGHYLYYKSYFWLNKQKFSIMQSSKPQCIIVQWFSRRNTERPQVKRFLLFVCSPPIAFCWSIYEDNTTSGLPVAESCLQSYWVDQCRLQIDHQFNSSCGYVLSVRASNDVSFEALAVRVDPKAPPGMLVFIIS